MRCRTALVLLWIGFSHHAAAAAPRALILRATTKAGIAKAGIAKQAIHIANLERYNPNDHRSVFTADYQASHDAFLRDGAEIDRRLREVGHPGAHIEAIPIPHPGGGPVRHLSYIHVPARNAGGGPKKLVVLTTGVHGFEAPAGAAMARTWMGGLLDKIDFEDTSLIIVHAVNPHGWAEGRRENLAGIDLNRMETAEMNAEQATALLEKPAGAGFNQVLDKLRLPGKAGGLGRAVARVYGRLVWGYLRGKYTRNDLVNALGYGQDHELHQPGYADVTKHPAEIVALNKLLEPVVASHDAVVHIDAHTGVTGKVSLWQRLTGRARLTAGLWTSMGQSASDGVFTQALARNRGRLLTVIGAAGQLYENPFDTPWGVQNMPRKPGTKVAALTLEHATLTMEWKTLAARILQYQGLRNGWKSETARLKNQRRLYDYFGPRDEAWRNAAMSNFRSTIGFLVPFLDKSVGDESWSSAANASS